MSLKREEEEEQSGKSECNAEENREKEEQSMKEEEGREGIVGEYNFFSEPYFS